jgi:hypothetical protein
MLGEWSRAAGVALAWFELGYAGPAMVFETLADPDAARQMAGADFDDRLLDVYGDSRTRDLVSLTLGHFDRLASMARVRRSDANYREFEQMAAAWRWLEPLADWRDLLSRLACDPRTSAPTTRALARLGLCLRLHRGVELRDRLDTLLSGRDLPADVATALGSMRAGRGSRHLLDDLRRLCSLRGGTLPRPVADAARRPSAFASELDSLEALPAESRDDRRRRRIDNLRRYLADPAALCDWVESDLRRLVGPALGAAALEAVERLAEQTMRSHALSVVGSAPPAGSDPRNWDNALRLYFVVDRNRGALRKLLRGEAAGDRAWITGHPANRQFLKTVAARGVDVAAWTGPFERPFTTPAGRWTVSLETDPLHVLQMGNYFETCLALDGVNAFSTIANACEADKRVAYVRDARGVVIGRKLLLLTPAGRVVGFRSYGAGALDRWEAEDDNANAGGASAWIKIVLDVFSRELADRCRAKLHPLFTQGKLPKDDPGQIDHGLFCRWYNDGPEPFDPPWLRHPPQRLRRQVVEGGRAREELKALLRGDASQRAAAGRVLKWLGEDAVHVRS